MTTEKKFAHLVVDTNAFINGAPIRELSDNVYTVQDVIDEVTSKRQLRQLSVLSYDLIVKDVFPENIQFVTEFSKKTGDYFSLSAPDIKVIALAYQLEKEKVGTSHLRTEPPGPRTVTSEPPKADLAADVPGFFKPNGTDEKTADDQQNESNEELNMGDMPKVENLQLAENTNVDDILVRVESEEEECDSNYSSEEEEDDDDSGWITTSNIEEMKKYTNGEVTEESRTVACITADFAMQNVLRQIGLNVATYDGRLIRYMRTFILRCYACFKTTSVMTKKFCPNCGHSCLKRVAVTLDENGQQKVHINSRKPLTARGKRFSLPAPRGGAHAQNPILTADTPRPPQKSSKQARKKNNPLDPDYIAGFSPFVVRDVNSKSAVLGIRSDNAVKNWMRRNPNENRRKRKK